MVANPLCAGACLYEDFKLEYQVINLEFIHNKLLKIEVVCINPYNSFEREATLKYSTDNLLSNPDERLKISYSIMNSVIKNFKLSKDKLRKLNIKDGKVFYICNI